MQQAPGLSPIKSHSSFGEHWLGFLILLAPLPTAQIPTKMGVGWLLNTSEPSCHLPRCLPKHKGGAKPGKLKENTKGLSASGSLSHEPSPQPLPPSGAPPMCLWTHAHILSSLALALSQKECRMLPNTPPAELFPRLKIFGSQISDFHDIHLLFPCTSCWTCLIPAGTF